MGKVVAEISLSSDVLAYRDEEEARRVFEKRVREKAALEPGGKGFCSDMVEALNSGGGADAYAQWWSTKTDPSQSSGVAQGFELFEKVSREEVSRRGKSVRDNYLDFTICSMALAAEGTPQTQANIEKYYLNELPRMHHTSKVQHACARVRAGGGCYSRNAYSRLLPRIYLSTVMKVHSCACASRACGAATV